MNPFASLLKMSLAYFVKYTNSHSVGKDPEVDYQIGADNKVVGSGGRPISKRDFHWFTIVNKKLIYNGLLGEQINDNPWASSGRHWNTYRVKYHHLLRPLEEVLAAAGVDKSVLPKGQNKWTKNPDVLKLIDYALAQVGSAPSS